MKIVMRRFNTYMPFVWGENSEKLYFRKTTATLAEKIFAVTFKRPCQITQVSNTMDISLLTFGEKMEVGHILFPFFYVFLDKKWIF